MKRFFTFPACLLLTLASASADIRFVPQSEADNGRDWAFEAGVAFMTRNNIGQISNGEVSIDDGDAGGEVYALTISRRLGEFRWQIGDHVFTPKLEVPLMLEIVDENARSPFLDYNASIVLRWVDFPWNDFIRTTFGTGVGLSYSSKVYLMDRQRHEGDHRSHLKYNWPLQLTFALPEYPDDQLMLYIAHQSGGRMFDRGGVNSLGMGYRREF